MSQMTTLPDIPSTDRPAAGPDHWAVLLLVVAGGLMVGAILHQKEPIYGANDASRWNTVYYLVEHGTYEFLPDHGAWWGHPRPERPRDIPPFATIDMIALGDSTGAYHYYSSKPPFLPTVLAGVVLAIEKLTLGRADFRLHPWFVIRTTLIVVQVVPMLIAFWLIRGHFQRYRSCGFVYGFSLAAVMLGTYLTAWAVTLNNHVIAAATGLFAVHAMIRIWYDGRREWYWFGLSGLFGKMTAAIELQDGMLAAAVMLLMLVKDWRRAVAWAVPTALAVTAVALYTNYLVMGSIWPAYTEVFKAGGCYYFPGSYWSEPTGIDALGESKTVYVLNMLVGHHGFFSLTPVLVLSLAGVVRHLVRGGSDRRGLAALVLLLTAAVTAVYAYKTNNYGGLCEGLRWLFWLVPLWLLFVAEGAALVGGVRVGRLASYVLLAVSMCSMADAVPRPWAQSWLHRLFTQFQWIDY